MQILICHDNYITPNLNLQSGAEYIVKYRLCRYDVMLTHNDVAHNVRSDVMFAKTLGEADITRKANIISEATSLARKGKHRSKNKSTSSEVLLFLAICLILEPQFDKLEFVSLFFLFYQEGYFQIQE